MIVYHLDFEQSGKFFHYFSDQFPSVNGYGTSQKEALFDFLTKRLDELDAVIRESRRFPTPLSQEEVEKKRDTTGIKAMAETATTSLTMYLHTAMLEKQVTRAELARMLALGQEVEDTDWQLDKIRSLIPKRSPQHKKVQRLLDVRHHSTIREIHEAFRVMDFSIDFVIRPKSLADWEPVLKF